MKDDRAVVISLDAMTGEDLEELSKRKNTHSLLSSSSLVENIHVVYPSLTYPCHASILTGCYPDKSGIYHNEILDIKREENPWFWWEYYHKRKTIIDTANDASLITAAIGWPTLAGKRAKYTIPEIWPDKATKDIEGMYRAAVSPDAWDIFEKNRHFLLERSKPFYDLFSTAGAVDIIKNHKPHLTLIHLSQLDHVKHKRGSDKSVLESAYDFLDERIGEIITSLKETGIYDDTTFFLLGDHGQMDVKRVFSINRVLKDMGYITTDSAGRIESYRILCHPASFSAEVYISDIDEKEAEAVLKKIQEEYPGTIDRIMTKFETGEIYHLSGPFSFVIESTGNLIYSYKTDLPLFMDRDEADKCSISYSTHGYAPERGPRPFFAVCGKRAEKGAVIPWARLIDEAPTILSLFSLKPPRDIDGRVIEGLLR